MAVSIAHVKPLEGKQAEKFIEAWKTSCIKEDAVEKAKKCMIEGFRFKDLKEVNK